MNEKIICEECNGKGFIKLYDYFDTEIDEVECPDCKGSGTITNPITPCQQNSNPASSS